MRRVGVILSVVILLFSLAGCGGGGGGGEGIVSGTSGGTTYLGAAGAGDFVRITIAPDNSSLSYEVFGPVFGNQTGTLRMESYPDKPHFYKLFLDNGTQVADMFLSGNMAFFGIYLDGNSTVLAGLKKVRNTLTAADVNGTYNYVHIPANGTGLAFYRITVYENGTYYAENILDNAYNETGCWRLSDTGDYLLAKAGATDCAGLTEDNATYRIVIKPGTHRGFVVDYVNGSGFGVGIESYNMTTAFANMTTCTAEYYWWDAENHEEGWGNATTGGLLLNRLEFYEEYFNGTAIGSDNASLIPDFADDGNTPAPGMAYIFTTSGNGTVFMDPDDGYFINIFNENGTIYYHIGHLSCNETSGVLPD